MRRLLFLLTALLLTSAGADPARGTLLDWTGTLQLSFGTLPPVVAFGSGVATVNGSGGLGNLTTLRLAGGITITTAIPLSDPNTPEFASWRMTGVRLGTGTLIPISGGGPLTQNTLPVSGNAKLCLLFVGCNAWINLPLTQGGTRGLGIGGRILVNGFGAGVRISLNGAPWTVGTAMLTGVRTTNAMVPGPFRQLTTLTTSGFVHGPLSGSFSGANAGAVIQLVSASNVATTLMAPSDFMPFVTTFTIHLTPEPGTLLLFGSGILAFGVAARRRARK